MRFLPPCKCIITRGLFGNIMFLWKYMGIFYKYSLIGSIENQPLPQKNRTSLEAGAVEAQKTPPWLHFFRKMQ